MFRRKGGLFFVSQKWIALQRNGTSLYKLRPQRKFRRGRRAGTDPPAGGPPPRLKARLVGFRKRQKLLQHIKKFPQSVDTERGNGGRPQAVSSSPCPGEELPLWSKLRKFLPSVDTERRNGGRPQAVSSGASPAAELPLWSKLRKFLPSVDTERRNGYNTYRVRPKRSATSWFQFLPLFRE